MRNAVWYNSYQWWRTHIAIRRARTTRAVGEWQISYQLLWSFTSNRSESLLDRWLFSWLHCQAMLQKLLGRVFIFQADHYQSLAIVALYHTKMSDAAASIREQRKHRACSSMVIAACLIAIRILAKNCIGIGTCIGSSATHRSRAYQLH
jgi:hypothetical protein